MQPQKIYPAQIKLLTTTEMREELTQIADGLGIFRADLLRKILDQAIKDVKLGKADYLICKDNE